MSEIERRRTYATERLESLRSKLTEAARHCEGKACVYVTGSYGRLEACEHSDLDLFILGKSNFDPDTMKDERELSRLDQICVKADLIQQSRDLKFDDFSGDGEYLQHYTVHQLTNTLGKRKDDAENTFTARLLLLLESQPLLENAVYERQVEDIVSAYFDEYEEHKADFMPAFFINGVLRLWRTFCVNYESSTKRQPEQARIKRKIKNFKLKHSRMLTLYSSVLYLLNRYRTNNTVSPDDMIEMVRTTPVIRLQHMIGNISTGADSVIETLLEEYERFLATTSRSETDLLEEFSDPTRARELMGSAHTFGDTVHQLLQIVGGGSRLHRLVVV